MPVLAIGGIDAAERIDAVAGAGAAGFAAIGLFMASHLTRKPAAAAWLNCARL